MSKPCENCGCDLKVCKDCDLYTGKYFKAELQAELEKIKAKVKNYIISHEEWFDDIYQLESCLIGIDDIFDRKFSELKGENNE